MIDQTIEERAVYYAAIERRTKALHRLLSGALVPPVPTVILAMHVGLLLRAAAAYCAPDLRDYLWGWLSGVQREEVGICAFCGAGGLEPKLGMCQDCWDQASAELDDEATS